MNINGPYGNYKSGSIGAVLNSLSEVYHIPTCHIDRLTFGNGKVFDGAKLYGMYEWLEDGTLLFVKRSGESK